MLIGQDFSMDDEPADAAPPADAPAAPRPPEAPGRGPDPLARKVEGFLEARRLKLEGHLRPNDRERRPADLPARPGPAPASTEPEVPPAGPRDLLPSTVAQEGRPTFPDPEEAGGRALALPENRELAGPATARPMVLIERQGHGLLRGLLPPALVLAVAGAILAFRVREPDWSGLVPDPPAAATGADAPRSANSSPVAPPGPVVARVKGDAAPEQPEPPPTEAVEADPPAKDDALAAAPAGPAAPPEEAPAPAPAPVEPTPLIAAADAFAEPPPLLKPIAKDETLREIRREAARQAAEADRNENLKARAAAREQAEARRRRAEQARRSEHFVDEDRPIFRDELRRVLKEGGSRAGLQIEDLCRQHKQVIPDSAEKAFKQARLTVGAKLSRRKRVEVYRRLGVPESRILYELANDELANIGMRNGLRNRQEALAVAARRLLEVPLPGPGAEPVAGAEPPPGTARADRPR